MGNITPSCENTGGFPLSCELSDQGVYQEFPFKSEPIRLHGTPPANGWKIFLEAPCCRGNYLNLGNGVGSILRSIMYSNKDNDPTDNCFNNSPRFAENIDYFSCRGQAKIVNTSVIDNENDSIVYSFSKTYDRPLSSPAAFPYASGFSFDNPTPNHLLDSNNIASQLNSLNGLLSYKISSGVGSDSYWIAIRADEYRSGHLISSTFREYPVYVYDCFEGDIFSILNVNARFNGSFNSSEVLAPNYKVKVSSGTEVRLDLTSILKDSTGHQFSANTDFSIASPQFSASTNDSSLCASPPCAEFLLNNQTTYDSTSQKFVGTSRGSYLGSIVWKTDCQHLDSNGSSKIYQFNLERKTQLCDTFEVKNEVINIEIYNEVQEKPILFCAATENKEKIKLSWDTVGIAKDKFQYWSIYGSRPNGGFELIDTVNTYYLGPYGGNIANFSKLDSGFFPNVYIKSNSMNCNFIAPGLSSDTVSKFAKLTQINDELVVQLSPPIPDYTFLWAKCNPMTEQRDSIFDIAGRKYTPAVSGYYSAIAGANSSGFKCIDVTDCIYYDKAIGLEELDFEEGLSIYPNPTTGKIQIEFGAAVGEVNITIRNIQGQLLKTMNHRNNNSVQLELPQEPGIYFIQLTNSKGERANLKVVKQ